MYGRWRFRIVELDYAGEYLRLPDGPLELQGSDDDAIKAAADLADTRAHEISHVEAISVGCPAEITERPGRLVIFVIARYDRRGWMLEGDLMHGSWHRSIKEAVTYGAFRTAGHNSETRILNVKAVVTHVVLIPALARRMTLY
jgi:hypothetical protein